MTTRFAEAPARRARQVGRFLHEKKGEDIVIMSLWKVTDMTRYFVICTASSEIHSRALANRVKEKFGRPWHTEGYSYAHWILLDYMDVVVHIFLKETRDYYGLERLWGDVPITKIPTYLTAGRNA
ncbi:ribosome silencing factor [candidate division WOR-3 bacterium]|nr:ribosome silencing factor [candidate division WOR-3 bacterium]